MRTMKLVPALLLGLATTSQAKSIDFTSQAGMEATCAAMTPAAPTSLTRDDERVAYAICGGLSLAQDAMAWWRTDGSKLRLEDPAARTLVRTRLESYLLRISQAREALERVNARAPLFVVAPGTWAIDLDGDGEVSLQERYFFWTPKADVEMSFFDRAHSEDAYHALYQAPVVKVDQSDVLWALAYCNFAEAALNLLLSYDFAPEKGAGVVLVDRARVSGVAYRRLRDGIRTSIRLRQALLAETDDDHEWIANPRQKNTSFPLRMDEQTFATWGSVLAELDKLLEGKALLGGRVDAGARRGPVDLTFGVCPPGSGIDLRALFTTPLSQAMNEKELSARCVAITAQKPLSKMAAILTASLQRNAAATGAASGEWQVLRHLYWVN